MISDFLILTSRAAATRGQLIAGAPRLRELDQTIECSERGATAR